MKREPNSCISCMHAESCLLDLIRFGRTRTLHCISAMLGFCLPHILPPGTGAIPFQV